MCCVSSCSFNQLCCFVQGTRCYCSGPRGDQACIYLVIVCVHACLCTHSYMHICACARVLTWVEDLNVKVPWTAVRNVHLCGLNINN